MKKQQEVRVEEAIESISASKRGEAATYERITFKIFKNVGIMSLKVIRSLFSREKYTRMMRIRNTGMYMQKEYNYRWIIILDTVSKVQEIILEERYKTVIELQFEDIKK